MQGTAVSGVILDDHCHTKTQNTKNPFLVGERHGQKGDLRHKNGDEFYSQHWAPVINTAYSFIYSVI